MLKKYRMSVALDVDDVLFPCMDLACETLKCEEGTSLDVNNVNSWDLEGTVYEPILKYFNDPEFFKKQKPYPGAQEFVRKLARRAEIFVVTAVQPEIMGVRVEQIKKFFPQIDEKNIIPTNRKDVIRVDVCLDDNPNNIIASNATYPIVFRRPWNKQLTGLLSVNSYDEFITIFDMIKDSYIDTSIYFSRPTVLCLVGPSGSGKTTIMNSLLKREGFSKAISSTTRPRRPSEPEDAYNFIGLDEFNGKMDDGKFVETTVYSGNHYGTESRAIEKALEKGHCIIPIDISGAFNIKSRYKTALFYIKRDKRSLISSIIKRLVDGEISEQDATERIASLDNEAKNEEFCDYVIENDNNLDDVINSILKVVKEK